MFTIVVFNSVSRHQYDNARAEWFTVGNTLRFREESIAATLFRSSASEIFVCFGMSVWS